MLPFHTGRKWGDRARTAGAMALCATACLGLAGCFEELDDTGSYPAYNAGQATEITVRNETDVRVGFHILVPGAGWSSGATLDPGEEWFNMYPAHSSYAEGEFCVRWRGGDFGEGEVLAEGCEYVRAGESWVFSLGY